MRSFEREYRAQAIASIPTMRSFPNSCCSVPSLASPFFTDNRQADLVLLDHSGRDQLHPIATASTTVAGRSFPGPLGADDTNDRSSDVDRPRLVPADRGLIRTRRLALHGERGRPPGRFAS
jgi:hypothetical protein